MAKGNGIATSESAYGVQARIAIRWFIGYGLQERLSDYSSLTPTSAGARSGSGRSSSA